MVVSPQSQDPVSPEVWRREVRPGVLQSFEREVYGRAPQEPVGLDWTLLEEGEVDGRQRRQLSVTLTGPAGRCTFVVLVHLPRSSAPAAKPPVPGKGAPAESVPDRVPVFLGLNFDGNHASTTDPEVIRPGVDPAPGDVGEVNGDDRDDAEAPPERGSAGAAWPVHLATERGYAVITAHYLQTGADHPNTFAQGVMATFGTSTMGGRDDGEWGSISMWAWPHCGPAPRTNVSPGSSPTTRAAWARP
ncbi:hypothetical protein [Sanguibacter sp. Z1732]|uniref:hypothetical protein n=1 Tax=Sanguibacter sp. Z1732 TaxID=3435412 RepID=UPI003D9C992E